MEPMALALRAVWMGAVAALGLTGVTWVAQAMRLARGPRAAELRRGASAVLTVPSTIVATYLFLGLRGADSLPAVVPGSLLGIAACAAYPWIYLRAADRCRGLGLPRPLEALATFALAALLWTLVTAGILGLQDLLGRLGIPALAAALGLYGLVALAAQALLLREPEVGGEAVRLRPWQWALRFGLSGTLMAVVVVLAGLGGPRHRFLAGILGVFPVVIGTTLLASHLERGAGGLADLVRRVPLGTLSLAAFALAARWTCPAHGAWRGCLAALVLSLPVVAATVWLGLPGGRRVHPPLASRDGKS